MKKSISILLAVLMLLASVLTAGLEVYAADDNGNSRAIAIVFDNSGSMYIEGNQAWCRATYAMEVFASMLNKGDTLLIYPMHAITVGGKEYTMENPFKVTDSGEAAAIRDIHTQTALGTPIESVDSAVEGLKAYKADRKYMIVLTDGDYFYQSGVKMTAAETVSQLDRRFGEQAGETMTVMYLGIGSEAVMPETAQSDCFVKKKAENSADTLSALTEMCNQIFGRDSMPKNRISGKAVEFDISMKKLILFVQGENVSDVKLTGDSGAIGEKLSSSTTKYGTAGCGNYDSAPDKSLQGMMVTYTDCSAGKYNIEYSGNATSIEIYYEPNADLDFVFTDAQGNNVDPNALYEGEYKVSFGMKDAKTGKLITSDLLGNPHYLGSYSINGQKTTITQDGYSGEVPITLNMDDSFEAELTVTYLNGYTISKDSSDFGWPEGGIKVAARPAGDFKLEITGGDELYSLQNLEDEGTPYIAKVFYQGEQLTGKELEKVELKWMPETSNAEIKENFADDHYELYLCYKDPDAPQDTVCGECTVTISAYYTAKGSSQAQAQCPLTYNIKDDFSPLQIEVTAPQDYIVISELAETEEITVKLTMKGEPLSAEDFAAVKLDVDLGGLEYTLTPDEKNSCYTIKLLATEGVDEKDYPVNVTATYTDNIGRETSVDDSASLTLSKTPLWLKWLIGLLLILLLIIIIVLICRIRVLPKCFDPEIEDCKLYYGGKDVTQHTTFQNDLSGGVLTVTASYNAEEYGAYIEVKPGKESYLCKPLNQRSAEVTSSQLDTHGNAEFKEVSFGSTSYTFDKATGALIKDPDDTTTLTIYHEDSIEIKGTILDNGRKKPLSITVKFNFSKN